MSHAHFLPKGDVDRHRGGGGLRRAGLDAFAVVTLMLASMLAGGLIAVALS